jgi:hypothetical protein
MKKEQHEELKKSFENISKLLEDQNLSIEERKKFETLKSQLAGALMSSWLPVGGGRKFIMFIIALIAVYFLAQSAYIAMIITLVILCMF